jgi:hypothetical protein
MTRKSLLPALSLGIALGFSAVSAYAAPAVPAAKPAAQASHAVPAKKPAAHARTRHHKKPWVATGHSWKNWGGAPFAHSDKEVQSDSKLDKFFSDAMSAFNPHQMPPEVAAALRQQIKDHPEGTVTYVSPDVVLPLMESAEGPMYDVPVAELLVSYGIYKTAKVRAWASSFNGTTWTVGYPFVCRNMSILGIVSGPVAAPPPPPPPPPPVAKAPCEYTFAFLWAGDAYFHGHAGPAPLSGDCPEAQMLPGETDFETDFRDNCKDWGCSLKGDAAEVGQPLQADGYESFVAPVTGWYVFRHPRLGPDDFELHCVIRPGRHRGASVSTTNGNSSLNTANGHTETYVVYGPKQLPSTWNGTSGLWELKQLPDPE